MASESANLTRGMAAFAASPFNVPDAIATGQPAGEYVRRPQNAKFFTYLHQFIPGTTTGWTAGAVQIRDQFQIDGDADFHVLKQARLGFNADLSENLGDTIAFEVSPVSESFNFVETYLSMYGSGRLPNTLQTPMVLPRNAVFTAKASSRLNDGEAAASIYFAHHGAKVYRNPILGFKKYRQQKYYTYVANFTPFDGGKGTIAAGQTDIFTLRLDGDSDFDIRKLTIVSDASILFQVRTDDDNWFSRPMRGELFGQTPVNNVGVNLTSSGELPFFLPVPRFISAAGYINVTVTNLDPANAINCQIGFWGTRLYPAGGIASGSTFK